MKYYLNDNFYSFCGSQFNNHMAVVVFDRYSVFTWLWLFATSLFCTNTESAIIFFNHGFQCKPIISHFSSETFLIMMSNFWVIQNSSCHGGQQHMHGGEISSVWNFFQFCKSSSFRNMSYQKALSRAVVLI